MIGGYQIISLHSTNNVLGTSYSIKGLYKKVKKTIKQIKLEDLIIDNIKMENVFINVHLDGDNYVGTFGLYQITFKSDDTYTIEENSGGSSGLYYITTDSYVWSISPTSTIISYDKYPNLKQLYLDQPSLVLFSKITLYSFVSSDTTSISEPIDRDSDYDMIGRNVVFVKLKDNVYTNIGSNHARDKSGSYRYRKTFITYLTLTETGFIINYTL